MKIPYVDLGANLKESILPFSNSIPAFIARGQYILGDVVTEFERRVAELSGTSYAVGVNSGYDALYLTLRALNIGTGDEVITTPNSFVATASAIANVGATPVFADVGEDRNLDVRKVRERFSACTKAVIVVHLAGLPAAIDQFVNLCTTRGVHLVEDCAQAFGSKYRSQPVGSFGIGGCFSFHPLKNMGALGDAGCIVTNDKRLAGRLQTLRNHGLVDRNSTLEWGINSRIDAFQALWLNSRLDSINDIIRRRQVIARRYHAALGDYPEILRPTLGTESNHSWHAYVIQFKARDELQKFLASKGIEALIHYPVPIHLQPAAYSLGYGPGTMPQCETQARQILSLPIRESLLDNEVEYVIGTIRSFFD